MGRACCDRCSKSDRGLSFPSLVMASDPVAGINDQDVDNKFGNVVVKSEPVDVEFVEDGVIQAAVPACGDPVPASVSFGDDERAGDVQFAEDVHGDSTECSSSFGDSGFGSDDDETESDTDATEVDSPIFSHINVDDTTAVPHIIR